jgi:hypothetical protein
MVRVALFAVVALAAGPQTLTYRPVPGPPRSVEGELSYNLEITGPDALVKQLVTANPVLSVTEIRSTRKGKATATSGSGNTSHVEIIFDSARVTGVAAGKPFQFDFTRNNSPATTMAADPPRVFSFGMTMDHRNYQIGPNGDYSVIDSDTDAQGEATAILVDGAVRLPDNPVKVGETWTRDFLGKRKHKNADTTFVYHQTARLDHLSEGPSPRAKISYTTTGVLNMPADKNPQLEQSTFEGKGYVVLEVPTGNLVESDTSGSITTELKKAGLKMVRRMAAKVKAP